MFLNLGLEICLGRLRRDNSAKKTGLRCRSAWMAQHDESFRFLSFLSRARGR